MASTRGLSTKAWQNKPALEQGGRQRGGPSASAHPSRPLRYDGGHEVAELERGAL
jgi:hypothetical protein